MQNLDHNDRSPIRDPKTQHDLDNLDKTTPGRRFLEKVTHAIDLNMTDFRMNLGDEQPIKELKEEIEALRNENRELAGVIHSASSGTKA